MNNSSVAHLWANPDTRKRNSARGSNFWFDGDTIYSYGGRNLDGLLARIYKGVVLVATQCRHWSSTSHHMAIAMRAVTHLTKFHVADASRNPNGDDVRRYREVINQGIARVEAAKSHKKWLLGSLIDQVEEANKFCSKFGFKSRFALPPGFQEKQNEKIAVYEAAESIRLEKRRLARIERDKQIELENAVTIQKWIAGEDVSFPWGVRTVYLRAKDGNMQTSLRATVPLADAEKAFRFAVLKREKGWIASGLSSLRVGDFALAEVTSEYIKAGCHTVMWPEVERFARLQGWI